MPKKKSPEIIFPMYVLKCECYFFKMHNTSFSSMTFWYLVGVSTVL